MKIEMSSNINVTDGWFCTTTTGMPKVVVLRLCGG